MCSCLPIHLVIPFSEWTALSTANPDSGHDAGTSRCLCLRHLVTGYSGAAVLPGLLQC